MYISSTAVLQQTHSIPADLVGGLLGFLSSTSLVLLVKIEEEIHKGPARNQTWGLIVRHFLPLSHWIQQSQLISGVFFLSCLCIVLIKKLGGMHWLYTLTFSQDYVPEYS